MDELISREGMLGALMDEYERALLDLAFTIKELTDSEFAQSLDEVTNNEHHRSVKSIVGHVIATGYLHADYIRRQFKISMSPPIEKDPETVRDAIRQMEAMILYMVRSLDGRWDMIGEEIEKTIIKTSWSTYDLEQLMEHAIVHILLHRRMIVKLRKHPRRKYSG